jgi:hypothetical protein
MSGPTIDDLWDVEAMSLEEASEHLGHSVATISRTAQELGFDRVRGWSPLRDPRYREAPCILCRRTRDRDEISERRTCTDCEERPMPYATDRWGQMPETEEDWLVLEKEAHFARRRKYGSERMAGVYTRFRDVVPMDAKMVLR